MTKRSRVVPRRYSIYERGDCFSWDEDTEEGCEGAIGSGTDRLVYVMYRDCA